MCKKLVTLQNDAAVMDAVRTFAKAGVRRLPVVNGPGQLVGILTIDDLMMLLGNEMGHLAVAAGLRRAR